MMIGFELSDEKLFKKLKYQATLNNTVKEVNWLKDLRELYENKQIYLNGTITSKIFLVNAKIF